MTFRGGKRYKTIIILFPPGRRLHFLLSRPWVGSLAQGWHIQLCIWIRTNMRGLHRSSATVIFSEMCQFDTQRCFFIVFDHYS